MVFLLEKDTNQLMNQLKKATDYTQLFEEHQAHFIDEGIKAYLTSLLKQKNMKKIDVIRNAAISEVTGYQYFDGKRKPSREKALALAIGFQLTVEETNALLKRTGYAQLYPKHHWDAIVIYGISHKFSLLEIDERLFEANLATFSES